MPVETNPVKNFAGTRLGLFAGNDWTCRGRNLVHPYLYQK